MKPLGIGLELVGDAIVYRVKTPSHVEDTIWRAVEEAIDANVTPERFLVEVRAAWADKLDRDKQYALDALK